MLGAEGLFAEGSSEHFKTLKELLLSKGFEVAGSHSSGNFAGLAQNKPTFQNDLNDIRELDGYYFNNLSRTDAEAKLANKPPDTFVLRNSSQDRTYALSFVEKDRFIHHCLIHFKDGSGYYIDGDKDVYENITALLHAYNFLGDKNDQDRAKYGSIPAGNGDEEGYGSIPRESQQSLQSSASKLEGAYLDVGLEKMNLDGGYGKTPGGSSGVQSQYNDIGAAKAAIRDNYGSTPSAASSRGSNAAEKQHAAYGVMPSVGGDGAEKGSTPYSSMPSNANEGGAAGDDHGYGRIPNTITAKDKATPYRGMPSKQ